MTVAELIEQLRQIPGNFGVYVFTNMECIPAEHVETFYEQDGTGNVVIS